jgi:hypothetical protein
MNLIVTLLNFQALLGDLVELVSLLSDDALLIQLDDVSEA